MTRYRVPVDPSSFLKTFTTKATGKDKSLTQTILFSPSLMGNVLRGCLKIKI